MKHMIVNKENKAMFECYQAPLSTPSMIRTRKNRDWGQELTPDSTSADESKQQHYATLQGCCWEKAHNSFSSRYTVMVEPIFDYQFRLILIGDSTVGKSSLLKYFTDGKFFEVGWSRWCSAWLPSSLYVVYRSLFCCILALLLYPLLASPSLCVCLGIYHVGWGDCS